MAIKYKKLHNKPLLFVLAEFRYSPVLKMEGFIPEIHEKLRHIYPLIEKNVQQSIEFKESEVTVTGVNHWVLLSKDKKSAVDIGPNRIVYMSSEYGRFDEFCSECKNILNVVQGVISAMLMMRVGLRYGNLIVVEPGKKIDDYVESQFSFPKALECIGESGHQKTESVVRTDTGLLVVRSLFGKHDFTCMPDAQGLPIALVGSNEISERMVLDFDSIWESKPQDFDVDAFMEKLRDLHVTSREAFWKITTEDAKNGWS